MREGYWVVRTYEAGPVGEKTKFFIPGKRPEKKNSRMEAAEIRKQEQNEYSKKKNLARLLNANYKAGDLLIGLDYSEAGMRKLEKVCARTAEWAEGSEETRQEIIYEAAEKELKLCIRRVMRAMDKEGEEIRYIAITSDMDGDTGESVRVHHHLVVNAEAHAAFLSKWTLGGVSIEPLSKQGDYTPIAEYLIKQVRRRKDAKAYATSRNLKRPQPKDRVALSDAPLRVPKGGRLIFCGEYRPGTPQYIRYYTGKGNRHAPEDGEKGAGE